MHSIGLARQQALTILRQFGLAPFRKILTPDDIQTAADVTGCAPQRERGLVPEAVVWLMLSVASETSSMAQGLIFAWGWITSACISNGVEAITESAFCQARQRLTLSFWRQLWTRLRSKYEQRFAPQLLWKGLRPLAVDGTETEVSNARSLSKYFGRRLNQQGESKSPRGRLVAVCSVLTGYCVDFVFTGWGISEHTALQHLVRRLRENDLLLLDRGFFSYAALYTISLRKAYFLMRLSKRNAQFPKRIKKLGKDDWLVEFAIPKTKQRMYPGLGPTWRCRLIRYQLKGFRPSWLLTSLLDDVEFSREDLVAFYHRRWRIETIYREWKHGLDIQNLRSQSPAGIQKEMYAQLLLNNLVRCLMTEAVEGLPITPLHLSFLTALTHVRCAIGQMLRANPQQLCSIYAQLLENIRRCVIRQRPGRSYPRPNDHKILNKGNGKLVYPARLKVLT